jgi:uncharacterized membrane protein
LVPIGLDGFSQLTIITNQFLYRESTPILRVITGLLFGFFTAWFGYPMTEEAMLDTRQFMEKKQSRGNKAGDMT